MRPLYFFLRPLLCASHGWVAFDFSAGTASRPNSSDYVRCIKAANAASLGIAHPLILQIKPEWLEHKELMSALEPRQAIFVLPSEGLANAKVLESCKTLRGQGYHLGVQITDVQAVKQIPCAAFDHVSMSAAFAHDALPASAITYLGDAGFRKIATDVNSHEMYAWLTGKDFSLCHSGFLAVRNPANGRQPDLARLKLLKLLSIVEHDGDTREIESIFREEPKLSYNLLRLVNSVAVGARTRISNFSQAIAILGRRQLQRWLQLLVYANNLTEGHTPNPLMQLAATRGRLIELLCKSIDPPPGNHEHCDNAFMTGLFSLLDVLLNMPMAEILKELPLQEEVENALRSPKDGGTLGQLLMIVSLAESGDFATVEKLLDDLDISPDTHAAAQVMALHWASRINTEHD